MIGQLTEWFCLCIEMKRLWTLTHTDTQTKSDNIKKMNYQYEFLLSAAFLNSISILTQRNFILYLLSQNVGSIESTNIHVMLVILIYRLLLTRFPLIKWVSLLGSTFFNIFIRLKIVEWIYLMCHLMIRLRVFIGD